MPLRANTAGHYILSAVDFKMDPTRSVSKCPEVSASFPFLVHAVPDSSEGGPHLPYTPDGLYRLETPRASAACKAVPLGEAQNSNVVDPKKISTKLRVNWGHASAQQQKRVCT